MNLMTRTAANQTVTVQLSPAIYNALLEAIIIINRCDASMAKSEHRGFAPTTPAEYVEELILTNLAERGLLKKR